MSFYREMIAAGFGGQGVMLLGQIVAHAALNEGNNVMWIPSYGPEMRGGTANCSVIVSDGEVASPLVSSPDVLIIMNQPSLAKFVGNLKKGGVLIYNEDLVTYNDPRDDINIVKVQANSIAMELGNEKVANIVVLGALAEAADIASVDALKEAVKEILGAKKAHLLEINMKAFEKGQEVGKQSVAQANS
ncbi:2-oxoglutarate ferredoxin oxidoreductase subunit gamma [Acetomicrobium thermoterrenum DSM 13490]|uniref:2-oxoglutarate ferredoxin oxidoreductase subunit gamma n=1 Tax=Acetomicrobium thermoterrenum DSM 13490 TaxID=1120987 RepID=A0A1H3GNE4_9BACT|nr:2-oxoacid:acceptor oxidoreductase family protein [Acetomicrobium thermoterrenum]SDY04138.1 2-oxoglutarate ferredoxin oxidoreductase subunit gamma [Acetomicrobium thermoterrenum DSM 13490]